MCMNREYVIKDKTHSFLLSCTRQIRHSVTLKWFIITVIIIATLGTYTLNVMTNNLWKSLLTSYALTTIHY